MLTQRSLAYHPERIFAYGLALLGAMLGVLGGGLFFLDVNEPIRISEMKKIKGMYNKETCALEMNLANAKTKTWVFPIPNLQKEIAFSLDPLRPDAPRQTPQVAVRLKQKAVSRTFAVPSRVDLVYQNGILSFSSSPSSFWLQLTEHKGKLEGKVFVDEQAGDSFPLALQECPIQSAQEFKEFSPFRILAEARWWGHDLVAETYFQGKKVYRLDMGSPLEACLLDIDEKGWLVFQDGLWRVVDSLHGVDFCPIARVKGAGPAYLEIEGWEENRHVRLSLPLASLPTFKWKAEEVFGSIRVRSDKQISCLLDKQCLILKVHDWVLKSADRWKILRKTEEKQAFLKGKLSGELFVLEQISHKQGQKSIQGCMYSVARTQMLPIDLPVVGRKSHSSSLQSAAEFKGKPR